MTQSEYVKEVRPVVRSLVALALYLRFGNGNGIEALNIPQAHVAADIFLTELEMTFSGWEE